MRRKFLSTGFSRGKDRSPCRNWATRMIRLTRGGSISRRMMFPRRIVCCRREDISMWSSRNMRDMKPIFDLAKEIMAANEAKK